MTADKTIIFQKLKRVISDVLDIQEDKIKSESKYLEDLYAESIDMAQLVIAIEEEFKSTVDENEVYQLKTVGDTVNFIHNKMLNSI